MHNPFVTILLILAILIDLWIIQYLLRLAQHKCACAMGWKRTFILVYWITSVVWAIGHLLDLDTLFTPTVSMAMFLFSVINVWVVLSYVARLEKEQCNCSIDMARDVMYLVSVVRLAIYVFFGIMVLVMVLTGVKHTRTVRRGRRGGIRVQRKRLI